MNRNRRGFTIATLAALVVPATAAAGPANLGGSTASMQRQHGVAVAEEFSFLATPAEVREYVEDGRLERVTESADLLLSDVSFPYVQPDVRVFIERIAAQYRAAVGDRLVITSLTRPTALQPVNAHALSVHPAGMAVDFRIPADAKARRWLERTLLELERAGVLDVTREQAPPHYHVAVYPAAYREYVARLAIAAAAATVVPDSATPAQESAPAREPTPAAGPAASSSDVDHETSVPAWLLLLSAAVGTGVLGARRIATSHAAA